MPGTKTAPAMRCPVLAKRLAGICLRACYAMSGSESVWTRLSAARDRVRGVGGLLCAHEALLSSTRRNRRAFSLRHPSQPAVPRAMCRTGLPNASAKLCGTELAYGATPILLCAVLR
eukprot:3791422-Rhodomonas_salina.2